MSSKSVLRFTVVLVLAFMSVTSAFGAWDVTYLHPSGWAHSNAVSISGGQQGGYAQVGGVNHAARWSGSAGNFVDMHPTGAYYSTIFGVSGDYQAGIVKMSSGSRYEAALWNGVANNWVSLHPASGSYGKSEAYGICGSQQIGIVCDPAYKACLWNGTAESFVSLHPAGKSSSEAWGTDGIRQVGMVDTMACLWTGTAGSYVNLHPDGNPYTSCAYAVSGGKQVGYVNMSSYGLSGHASLWSGTAGSWVDLHPAGWDMSAAKSIDGEWQVGSTVDNTTSTSHAALWRGTAASWVDLQSFLSASYNWSEAEGIDVIGNDIWISGMARRTTGRWEAVMWHTTVPEPSSMLALGTGLLALAGLVRRRRSTFRGMVDGEHRNL